MATREWSDLSRTARVLVITAGVIQVTLAVAAGVDLARRPAEEVRGPKPAWAAALLINTVGPIAYFVVGRR